MKKGIYVLPTSLTLCGMFAGFYSIMLVLKGSYVPAAWAILAAGVFDALDGFVARLTQSTTKFGIELDSLSDVVAFGVAPAVLVHKMSLLSFGRVGAAVAFLFVACGAMRLARYNIQMGSTERKSFTGMPIPAAAWVCATSVLFYGKFGLDPHRSVYFLLIAFVCAILMVSTLRFHSLKEFNLRKRKPFGILVGLVLVFVIFVMHPEITLFVGALGYLASGIMESIYLFLRKPKAEGEA